MKKNYFSFIFIVLTLFAFQQGMAQNNVGKTSMKEKIEGLTIYPNPLSTEDTYVYIASKLNTSKQIDIFNVLGKQIFTTRLSGKALNISNLRKGVYIIKITENGKSESRKLVLN